MQSNKGKIQAVFDHLIELLLDEKDFKVICEYLPEIINLGLEIDDIDEIFELPIEGSAINLNR